jgi:hypothetical protein
MRRDPTPTLPRKRERERTLLFGRQCQQTTYADSIITMRAALQPAILAASDAFSLSRLRGRAGVGVSPHWQITKDRVLLPSHP